MKRTVIGRDFDIDNLSMANCLMLLSNRKEYDPMDDSIPSRVFECRTCNRQFSSFQALGGHRASHKKPKLATSGDEKTHTSAPMKPKTHECSICGLEFAVRQALGGHMRRHRVAMNDSMNMTPPPPPPSPPDLLPSHPTQVPQAKKLNGRRSVLCLDLNLTPMENVLEFRLGHGKPVVPVVHCYL